MVGAAWKLSVFAGLLMTAVGCVVPDYFTPGGFSSTYHQRMTPVRRIEELRPLNLTAETALPAQTHRRLTAD